MHPRGIILLLCVVLLSLTAGCNGARESDEVAYVITLGVDTAPDNQLAITYRIAVPQAIAGGEGGGAGKKKASSLITITAPSLAEGRNLLNSAVSRAPNLSHITAFIIGEDLARKGLRDFIGPLLRFREFRGSMLVIVARGSAREMMEKNDPEIEILPSRWLESMFTTFDETNYFLKTNLHQFYKQLKGDSGAPYAAALGSNPLTSQNQAEKEPVTGDKSKEYLPEEMPRIGGNPVSVIGTAVFKEDKLAGFLTDKQTRAMAILMGNLPRAFLTVEDPLIPERPLHVNMRLGSKPHINIDITGEIPVISVEVFLEGEITSIPSGIFYESVEYKTLLESQISNVIYEQITEMLQITQQWNTDVVNFGYYIRPKFQTMQDFEAYNWDSKYPQAIFNVTVKTEIRRTGLLRKTMPIRREHP